MKNFILIYKLSKYIICIDFEFFIVINNNNIACMLDFRNVNVPLIYIYEGILPSLVHKCHSYPMTKRCCKRTKHQIIMENWWNKNAQVVAVNTIRFRLLIKILNFSAGNNIRRPSASWYHGGLPETRRILQQWNV